MTKLDAKNMPAKELCARIRESTDTALAVEHVNGQRYIAAVSYTHLDVYKRQEKH